jgi:hypothetical protein
LFQPRYYGHASKIVEPGRAAEITGKSLTEVGLSGATRQNRTGDLLITKFRVWRDVVDSRFGGTVPISANSP